MDLDFGLFGHRPRVRNPNRICHFFLQGRCRFGAQCRNSHVLTSNSKDSETNVSQNDGASSSSVVTSQANETEERACGICFDEVLSKEKEKNEQVFGILPNCNHCYCFSCIRKWRQSKEFEYEVSKSCPECRIASDYVYPSSVWVETKEEKEKFINERKNKMQTIDCKYFRKGHGRCPFGNSCLYLHQLLDGKKVDVGPPLPRRNRMIEGGVVDLSPLQDILMMMDDDIDNNDIDFVFDYIDYEFSAHFDGEDDDDDDDDDEEDDGYFFLD